MPEGVTEPRMRVNLRPGAGEYFHMPAYTLTGPCDVLLVEAVPGGPFDIFTDRPSPAEHLRRLRAMLLEHFPWEGELYAHAEPTDARASLVGAFPGTVRRPYAEVAPGSHVFGIGDVVVVNDPISGQGANNAAHAAGMYLEALRLSMAGRNPGDSQFDDLERRDLLHAGRPGCRLGWDSPEPWLTSSRRRCLRSLSPTRVLKLAVKTGWGWMLAEQQYVRPNYSAAFRILG